MSWHIYITRRSVAGFADGGVSLPEWLAIVASDASLRLVPFTLGPECEPIVHWIDATSERASPENRARFTWQRGAIRAAGPDDATIAKLWEIAQRLGGHIEDDDGCHYDHNAIPVSAEEEFARYA